MRLTIGYITALAITLLIFCQAIIIPSFFMPFFRHQFASLGVAETIQVSDEDLMYVTVGLLDYMRGRRDTLDGITAVVAGVEREFYSDLEKRHMVDVRVLYDILFMVRNITVFVVIALILLMALFKYPILQTLARCTREVLTGFLILLALLVIVIVIDFDRAFYIFHRIFFDNDYWLLNPHVDLLINMVPIYFFIDISIFIAAIMVLVPIAISIAATLYLRNKNRRLVQ